MTAPDHIEEMASRIREMVDEADLPVNGTTPLEEVRKSWAPVDLAEAAAEGLDPLEPDLLFRRDGHGLIYRDLVNVLFGQPEAGKSWIALAEAVRLIRDAERRGQGKVVLWIDYEDTARVFLSRLTTLGISIDEAIAHVEFIAPEGPLSPSELQDAIGSAFVESVGLVVVDSVNECMVSYGLDPLGLMPAVMWRQNFLKPLQAVTPGAAILLIDHEPIVAGKDRRNAIGSQAKFSGVQGSQLRAIVMDQPAPGQDGSVAIYVTKDRNGGVRAHGRKSDTTVALVATAQFNTNEAGRFTITFLEPQGAADDVEMNMAILELVISSGEAGISKTQNRDLLRAKGLSRSNGVMDTALEEATRLIPGRFEAFPKNRGTAYRQRPDWDGGNELPSALDFLRDNDDHNNDQEVE